MMKEVPQTSHKTWRNKFLIKTKALCKYFLLQPSYPSDEEVL